MSNPFFPNNQYFDLSHINQKLISKIHRQVKKQHSVTGAWTDQENLIYAQFIEDNPYQFQTAQKRRRFKVFQRMALKLQNRTSIQCRSHNQKIVKLAGSIMKVPQYIKKRLCPQGRKLQTPIQIRQEQKDVTEENFIERSFEQNLQQPERKIEKQETKQKRFELPLKLCIELISDKIEEYC